MEALLELRELEYACKTLNFAAALALDVLLNTFPHKYLNKQSDKSQISLIFFRNLGKLVQTAKHQCELTLS